MEKKYGDTYTMEFGEIEYQLLEMAAKELFHVEDVPDKILLRNLISGATSIEVGRLVETYERAEEDLR